MGISIDESMLYEMGYNTGFKDGIKGSILKADYENRLKADMVAMLTELQLEIEEIEKPLCHSATYAKGCVDRGRIEGLIQQKINALKGE